MGGVAEERRRDGRVSVIEMRTAGSGCGVPLTLIYRGEEKEEAFASGVLDVLSSLPSTGPLM